MNADGSCGLHCISLVGGSGKHDSQPASISNQRQRIKEIGQQ